MWCYWWAGLIIKQTKPVTRAAEKYKAYDYQCSKKNKKNENTVV